MSTELITRSTNSQKDISGALDDQPEGIQQ